MKVLGGSKKESSKYLRVQGGRVLYRFTVRVKLPKEASGGDMGFRYVSINARYAIFSSYYADIFTWDF
jgi:hypothetical protein